MDDNLNQYCRRLQEELKLAQNSLARLEQNLVSPELTPLADWQAWLQAATNQWTARREPAHQAAERLEQLEHRAGVPFDDSHLDRGAMKAENQADWEDALALDALVVATYAVLQAEVAILNAFEIRKTAIDLERSRNTF
jgi:hypothetical protein